jgi:hypothetical protein
MDIFISRPTKLEDRFEDHFSGFMSFLKSKKFNVYRLGSENFSKKAPLRKVIDLIKRCEGAIIIGYPQTQLVNETRRGPIMESQYRLTIPTPWNQIEGAVAYALGKPVLVISQTGITGGVFDYGVTGEGVVDLDLAQANWFKTKAFLEPFGEWQEELAGVK